MTDEEKIVQTEEAPTHAVYNQFSTMLHERWIAANRIYALKAEMARRGLAIVLALLIATPAFAQRPVSPKYTQVGPDCVETSEPGTTSASGQRIARDIVCTRMAGKWTSYTGWEIVP